MAETPLEALTRATAPLLQKITGDDDVTGNGPCAGCDHDPACGYASTWNAKDGEQWWCHTDAHSCYAPAADSGPF